MQFSVVPAQAQIDAAFQVVGEGFAPSYRLTIRSYTTDVSGRQWQGITHVTPDAAGHFTIANAPELLWNMQPEDNGLLPSLFIPRSDQPLQIKLEIYSEESHLLATTYAERFICIKPFIYIDVDEADVKGRLLMPEGEGSFPGVVLCSGSEGGIFSQLLSAQYLVSKGYAVFIAAFYNYLDLPKELYDIPLETFKNAINYFAQRDNIIADKIAIIASSKGAEGVLAAAANFTDFPAKAIVVMSPSAMIWQGIGRGKPKAKSSWSISGKSLPYMDMKGVYILPQFLVANFIRKMKLEKALFPLVRISLAPAYIAGRSKRKNNAAVAIDVGKIDIPLLAMAGESDRVWYSADMLRVLKQRREQVGIAKRDEYYFYPNAGHLFQLPNMPATASWMARPGSKLIPNFGGHPAANAFAHRDAWQRIERFLERHI